MFFFWNLLVCEYPNVITLSSISSYHYQEDWITFPNLSLMQMKIMLLLNLDKLMLCFPQKNIFCSIQGVDEAVFLKSIPTCFCGFSFIHPINFILAFILITYEVFFLLLKYKSLEVKQLPFNLHSFIT